jgi:tRNA pseudouridine55 synthase
MTNTLPQGLLLVDKPSGRTSFSLVHAIRKKTSHKRVGHGGTLDPFATGLLAIFLGREATRISSTFLTHDKEYLADLLLGVKTDTFDREGKILETSSLIPSEQEIHEALKHFQGDILQLPPMFSAKRYGGKRLYELARKGLVVERAKVPVHIALECLDYSYPSLKLRVSCSKGTYIRSLADDIGTHLGCFAHLKELRRTRSGPYSILDATPFETLLSLPLDALFSLLRTVKPC